jgi:hypothetical protein
MPDIEFIKQGNKMDKYINPIQSEDDDHNIQFNEREIKESSFRKFHQDNHNDDMLDNMMTNLNINENKTGMNPNYYVT